ncbi:hypothetical protein EOT10_28880 [Streptomyces antnestii]|uniref:Uncharacterized protein n=1 Tax=Streptomyces antnestii TaxID=2494256 RepID=A0A3S2VAT5_9ACTN|nr:hypothetical protein [Streptomyces sp. San01]RVU20014.1 hypothetical protein EOT10_28880 [Streptomyces sp. San01]
MEHHIIAEMTEPGGSTLKEWHMVRGEQPESMCGRELDLSAQKLSSDAWGTDQARPFCHTCGALFLREVP